MAYLDGAAVEPNRMTCAILTGRDMAMNQTLDILAPIEPLLGGSGASRPVALIAFTRFASGVVHEVNNPLGIALLSAQQAVRCLLTDSPPQLKSSLERVVGSIRRAANAIQGMLQICDEDLSPDWTPVRLDVREVLRSTAAVMPKYRTPQGLPGRMAAFARSVTDIRQAARIADRLGLCRLPRNGCGCYSRQSRVTARRFCNRNRYH